MTDTRWLTPSVRHLAWLCEAPSLTASPKQVPLQQYLPDNLQNTLIELDRNPQPLLTALALDGHLRLGIYFERLYGFLMSDLLGWPTLLRNQPVRDEQRTLGELDFVFLNPATGLPEHHEIAVKFYLGYAPDNRWYGPNAKDRLDLKTHRLLNHQSKMTERPETRALLASHGITSPPEPRVFMPGYLFYPGDNAIESPASAPKNHARGRWCRAHDLEPTDTKHWIVLNKPHWLGPAQQCSEPDETDTQAQIEKVKAGGPPRLFAEMEPHSDGGWQESERWFVVPDCWP
nr:DUF1853 family protein [Marinobacter sp. BGYM27]